MEVVPACSQGWQSRFIVNCERQVRFWKSREEAVLEHRDRTLASLFRWLSNQHQRAVPALAILCQQLGGAVQLDMWMS